MARMRKREVAPPVKLPLYMVNPTGNTEAPMRAGRIGYIDTPRQGNLRPAGVQWCADNGAFSEAFDEGEFLAFLEANADKLDGCLFATVPDVVGDAEATLERGWPWFDKMIALGYPVAFVAQNGWAAPGYVDRVPWDLIDVLFIGGDDEFKLGPEGRQAIRDAQARGKRVHMGRVNAELRHRYAAGLGVDTVDGTYLTYGPDVNLARLLAWIDRIEADVAAGNDDAWRGRQAYVPAPDELAEQAPLVEALEVAPVWRPVAGRDPHAGPVGVYKNLAARDPKAQWSAKALAGPHRGLKVAEGEQLAVRDAGAFVRESTRQRILGGSAGQAKGHLGHREVHAWITGWLVDEPVVLAAPDRVTYRPFERGEFFRAEGGEAFDAAPVVVFGADGNAYAEGGAR